MVQLYSTAVRLYTVKVVKYIVVRTIVTDPTIEVPLKEKNGAHVVEIDRRRLKR